MKHSAPAAGGCPGEGWRAAFGWLCGPAGPIILKDRSAGDAAGVRRGVASVEARGESWRCCVQGLPRARARAQGEAPAAEAPAAEEADKKPLTEKDLKKVAKPDETVLKERIAVEDAKIVELQARLTGIKESLDSHESGRGEPNSELAIAKSKYNELRQESRRLQQVCAAYARGSVRVCSAAARTCQQGGGWTAAEAHSTTLTTGAGSQINQRTHPARLHRGRASAGRAPLRLATDAVTVRRGHAWPCCCEGPVHRVASPRCAGRRVAERVTGHCGAGAGIGQCRSTLRPLRRGLRRACAAPVLRAVRSLWAVVGKPARRRRRLPPHAAGEAQHP
eukprot:1193613-Prymnesium_polylepis.1